ncbi:MULTISPECIES: metal ABC transporter solute-binding protein, Zn/Mn family [unclassified Pseudomonas]|uniref:metal ABC transporter solute-binding protein, Zn/Mn family n=1 Tax=unclassified Pseudomonas TaxID=196821 RepID=UPI00119C32FB|nr:MULTISPECIES: zinc ABC transporter substrate-binding protein [unclassified Pseudomonas]TWC22810.1 zinc transport system substrate-binding protein [Pseudomonas sp. SJZ075]TWC24927.1 zinc transport system substrate-binding protein [Pseudomonas sp. SJZ074]TWC38310.1 zinc transport system substrate-binding protein [Pseudomonas sp. SJZ078]TWC40856.1 zinc transport system substrate-binding protein [Pseudomonas sp. SJZ085]TWC58900.1 zinc transport system substrate-binding protein [Pseudomonas sp. 
MTVPAKHRVPLRRWIALLMLIPALLLLGQAHAQGKKLKVGVTLHPYYSFVANIVGDRAEVVALIPAEANPHNYQPQPADITRAMSLDALVVNGIGHDQWAFQIVKAAGRSENLPIIQANATVALIPIGGDQDGAKVVNPHTFVSTTAAIQQVFEIARRLGELDPDNAAVYRHNALAYAGRIRALRARFMTRFANLDLSSFRCASTHAGYDYLMQEFGLFVSAVIEPRHGVAPTARQLANTIDAIKKANVRVLFAEKYFSIDLAKPIEAATGVRVFALSHITGSTYSADEFEVAMSENLETLAEAVEFTQQQ